MKQVVRAVSFTLVICAMLALGCSVVTRSKAPGKKASSRYLTHVVRFNGESMLLIARWYTKNEQNADRIAMHNMVINDLKASLPPNTRILIPRNLLRTEKMMPVEFVIKNSEGKILVATPPVSFRKGSPVPTKTSTPTPTHTPVDTATPTRTTTPRPTRVPTRAPSSTPTKKPTKTPKAEKLEAFELEDEAQEKSQQLPDNKTIQIPKEIIQDLKQMDVQKPKAFPERAEELIQPERMEEPTVPSYFPPPMIQTEEPEATISDERKKLLDLLKKGGAMPQEP